MHLCVSSILHASYNYELFCKGDDQYLSSSDHSDEDLEHLGE